MPSIEWEDLYLSPDQYFEFMYEIVKKSDVFDDMNTPWHPEDLHYTMFSIFETAGKSIVEFTNILRTRAEKRIKQRQYNSDKKTVDDAIVQETESKMRAKKMTEIDNEDCVQVFGGTLPSNVFGDNV